MTLKVSMGMLGSGLSADADTPPVVANAMDDEFSGSSLDPKWSKSGEQSGMTMTVGSGRLVIYVPSTYQARLYNIVQPAPSGNWKMRMKAWWESPYASYFGIGLIARRTTGGTKDIWAGILEDTSPVSAYYRLTAGVVSSNAVLAGLHRQPVYLEMEWDGVNLTWRSSSSGISYGYLWSETGASFLGGAPEYVGINVQPYAGTAANALYQATFAVDWFRRVA